MLLCSNYLILKKKNDVFLSVPYPLERYRVSAGTVSRIRWNGIAYPLERYRVSAGYGIKYKAFGACHFSWLNAAVATCCLFSQRV